MPDELSRPVPRHLSSDRDSDLLDQALEFRAAYKSWPGTWIEFNLGVAHLSRASAAEKLRLAEAFNAPHQKPDAFRQWQSDLRYLAGG